MNDRVTSHAIIRYIERVLGQPVDAWLVGMDAVAENIRAAHCCERAGLPVDAVRELILHPAILRVCAAGFTDCVVRLDGFAYLIKRGKVITIMPERYRDEKFGFDTKARIRSRKECRLDTLRKNRRHKDKHKNRNKRLAEVDS